MSYRMKKGSFLWILILAFVAFSSAATFSGRCVAIGDGDTISVLKSGAAVKIRVEGIDCPELGQAFGTAARKFTASMVFGKIVQVREVTIDQYGRPVARVVVDGADLSLELVKAGLAWHYATYSSDPVLAAAELKARQSKIGLWSMSDPTPPWVYRRKRRK